jgi:adenylate kinase family enzyme
LIKKIKELELGLDKDEQEDLNRMFTRSTKHDNINIKVKFDDDTEQQLSSGKEYVNEDSEKSSEKGSEKSSIKSIVDISLTKDVLPFIIPLTFILTIKMPNSDILENLYIIKTTPSLLSIFQTQAHIWWNNPNIINKIEQIVEKYIKKNSCIYNISIQFKLSLLNLIDNPKKLLELINDCLKPKDIEKKKYGEVFTPIYFINSMLDELEVYYKEKYNKCIFEDENLTWGDTTAGMGNFPVAIYYKLMDGLKTKISDEKERKKHILEKMLYMAEYNRKNCFIIKQIFDLNDEFNLNLYEGDSLQLDIKKEFGISKFDIIIGNPPYNEELKSTGAKALYNKFVEYYIDKCNMLCFIIPSRWFSGGKGLDSFRENMLKRKDIVYIKHFDDASKIFGNTVDIKGGIQYFLKDINYNGDCNFNGYITKLNKYDVFVDGRFHTLIDGIVKFESITKLYKSQDYYKIQTNDIRLKTDKTKDTIKCYVSQQKGFEKYIDKKEIKKDCNFWKVITARASHEHKSGFGNIFIGKPNEVHCKTYISFEINNENEAKSLLSYMKCRLPNFMLSLRKNSQDISESTCEWIPLPPLDREWTDKKVYKYFKLTADDMAIIENTNIVGYKKSLSSE